MHVVFECVQKSLKERVAKPFVAAREREIEHEEEAARALREIGAQLNGNDRELCSSSSGPPTSSLPQSKL